MANAGSASLTGSGGVTGSGRCAANAASAGVVVGAAGAGELSVAQVERRVGSSPVSWPVR
jgi:hypothetical protein